MAESHRLVRASFVVAAGFGAVAVTWAVLVLARGGSWWGPIHTFLVGAVLAAISGATQMFTATWSSAPAPPRTTTLLQRIGLIVGTALVLVGVSNDLPTVVWTGGLLVAASLALLALILLRVIRQSLLRRFDLSIRFYLLALGCGVVGVTLGILLGSGALGETYATTRLVHLHLNLVGLVGFTILGTLPTLLPTFAHHRTVSGREAPLGWGACVAASLLMTAGLVGPTWLIGAGTLLAGVVAVAITGGIVGRLGVGKMKEMLPFLHVVFGVAWLAVWTGVDGVGLITGTPLPLFSGWTAAAIVAGIGQVLVGSVTYLAPVVMGAPVAENLRRVGRLPALPVVLLNVTGIFLVLDLPTAASVTGAAWLIDLIGRLSSIRRPQPASAD